MENRYQIGEEQINLSTAGEFRGVVIAVCCRVYAGSQLNEDTVRSVLKDHGKTELLLPDNMRVSYGKGGNAGNDEFIRSMEWIGSINRIIMVSSMVLANGDKTEQGIRDFLKTIPDRECCLRRMFKVYEPCSGSSYEPLVIRMVNAVRWLFSSISQSFCARACVFTCILYVLIVFYIVMVFDPFGYSYSWSTEDCLRFSSLLMLPPAMFASAVFAWVKWVNPCRADMTKV